MCYQQPKRLTHIHKYMKSYNLLLLGDHFILLCLYITILFLYSCYYLFVIIFLEIL